VVAKSDRLLLSETVDCRVVGVNHKAQLIVAVGGNQGPAQLDFVIRPFIVDYL